MSCLLTIGCAGRTNTPATSSDVHRLQSRCGIGEAEVARGQQARAAPEFGSFPFHTSLPFPFSCFPFFPPPKDFEAVTAICYFAFTK